MSLKEGGTGTQYHRNRYVDPGTGRFTQEDPIGLAGELNLYEFAAGGPVNFRDRFGLCASGGDGGGASWGGAEQNCAHALARAAVVSLPWLLGARGDEDQTGRRPNLRSRRLSATAAADASASTNNQAGARSWQVSPSSLHVPSHSSTSLSPNTFPHSFHLSTYAQATRVSFHFHM